MSLYPYPSFQFTIKMGRCRIYTRGITLSLLFLLSDCLHLPPAAINNSLLSTYDYIVVGGGPSGLTLANRLSENSDGESASCRPSALDASKTENLFAVTVLLLEAGVL